MAEISVVLILLAAIVLSEAITKIIPFGVPLPLVQIGLGALIAAIGDLAVTLNPDIFFLLFIPPLLFLDGWRIPKQPLFKDASTILELALGLVIFTVIGIGFFIHWLIPAMPLPVALALAAILSPTDPIAVSAITSRVPVPQRMMHILEGESLLNDASGLVCMRFALAAALTGSFSFSEAALTFLWLALGGIAIGVGVTWIVAKTKDWISHRFGEGVGAQILISLLIPFAAYLIAEELHCSGILAAVGAGITMSYAELWGHARGETRMQRAAVWNTVQFTANGAIFLILGEQIPRIFAGAAGAIREAGRGNIWVLPIYAVVITGALICLRFIWTWTSLKLTLYRAHLKGVPRPAPSLKLVAAVSFAGVRGAITLAGVLTFPLAMPDGSPFPARDLSILLAAGVIILSLLAASASLPHLLADVALPPVSTQVENETRVRIAAAHAAIVAMESVQASQSQDADEAAHYAEAALTVIETYRSRLERRNDTPEKATEERAIAEAERQLRIAALTAARDEIFRQARSGQIDDQLARKLVKEMDLREAGLIT